MNNINYADQIVKNLEGKGCSKDYIIEFLSSTLSGLKNLNDSQDVMRVLKSMVKYTSMIDNTNHAL